MLSFDVWANIKKDLDRSWNSWEPSL